MQAAPSDGGPHVQILHNLLGALNQSRQDLPPAILELLDAQTSVDHKAESRALHKLVSTQATAKQELQQVRQAYLAQWSQYMQQLCSTWESSLQEKEAMLASLDEAEERWTSQLSGATQELAKQASGKSEGVVEVDDSSDDLEATEAMVVDAAQQEADRLRAREQLQAQEKKLSESLAEAGTQEQLDACKHRERSPRRKTKAREEPLSEKPATTEPDNAHPGKAS